MHMALQVIVQWFLSFMTQVYMAKAKAENTKREAIKKSFTGAKASLKLNKILKLQAEKFDATITK